MSNLQITNVLVFFLATTHSIIVSRRYSTEVEFDHAEPKNEILGKYKARSLCMCSAKCRKDCRFFGYNNNLKLCRVYRKVYTTQKSNMENGWRYFFNNFLPLGCSDLREDGHTTSGVYDIYPYSTGALPIRAYCDMETMNGGWTAIQKRINGFQSFDQKWPEYKNGFGDPEQDYWIGDSMLKTGTSGADLAGSFFSTPGTDNDRAINGVCTKHCSCGWWMNKCFHAYLNGPWYPQTCLGPWRPTVLSGKYVTGTKMIIKRH